jgi:hypothetical protein
MIPDLALASNSMTEIITKTRKALLQRVTEHEVAIDIVAKWEEFARTAEPSVIYAAVKEADLKKTQKTSVWAAIQNIMNTRGFEFSQENKMFIPLQEKGNE